MFLLAYDEIALKSAGVRRLFTKRLLNNILWGLERKGIRARAYHKWSRVFVELEDEGRREEALEVLRKVFGVVYVAPCTYVELKELEQFVAEHAEELLEEGESFAVRVKRTGEHPFTSVELAAKLGKVLKERTSKKIDLKSPEVTVYVEVRNGDCYVYSKRYKAPGGLPLSTAGCVVSLLSGGLDSPVASWMLMKRGCRVVALHARLGPAEDLSDMKSVLEVARALDEWHIGKKLKLYAYDHEKPLSKISSLARSYTCLLCKRFMYRVAEALASKVGAKAIVTGENLAQVASQTLENLYVLEHSVSLPVFRPLLGLDKHEIVELAKEIGTYEASAEASTVACWARPRKPVTKGSLEKVLELEAKIGVEKLLEEALRTLRKVPLE